MITIGSVLLIVAVGTLIGTSARYQEGNRLIAFPCIVDSTYILPSRCKECTCGDDDVGCVHCERNCFNGYIVLDYNETIIVNNITTTTQLSNLTMLVQYQEKVQEEVILFMNRTYPMGKLLKCYKNTATGGYQLNHYSINLGALYVTSLALFFVTGLCIITFVIFEVLFCCKPELYYEDPFHPNSDLKWSCCGLRSQCSRCC